LSGLPRATVIQRVLRHGARPVFPPAAPSAYVALAEACWVTAPADRPPMGDVAAVLSALAAALARAGNAAAPGGGGGGGGAAAAPAVELASRGSSPL
jgi:hypothetical protein